VLLLFLRRAVRCHEEEVGQRRGENETTWERLPAGLGGGGFACQRVRLSVSLLVITEDV